MRPDLPIPARSEMTQATPILTPSGYAPAYAVGYADPLNCLVQVSEQNPRP